MNVIIPDGWHQVPLGEPVFYHDLIWEPFDLRYPSPKGWKHVRKFGDFCKKNNNKYVIRQNNIQEELMRTLRNFPNAPYSQHPFIYKKEYMLAYILYLAGAKEIKPSVRYMSGTKKLENLILDHYSFEVHPYIELPMTNGQPLVWYLLEKLGIRYCGGASKDKSYVQASWQDKDGFILKLIAYFNAIVNEFDTNK